MFASSGRGDRIREAMEESLVCSMVAAARIRAYVGSKRLQSDTRGGNGVGTRKGINYT